MTRSSSAQAMVRKLCFQEHHEHDAGGVFMVCHICNGRIYCATEAWEAEHVIPGALGGTVVAPAHVKCHRKKTSEHDIPAIAKAKRVSEKHTGLKRKGWGGKFKRKVSGETVER